MNRLYHPKLREVLVEGMDSLELTDVDPAYLTGNEVDDRGDEIRADEPVTCDYCFDECVDYVLTEHQDTFSNLNRQQLRNEIPAALEGVHERWEQYAD